MRTRLLAAAIVAAATVGGALVFDSSSSLSAQPEDARIRVAHFSPDAPSFDFYIDGKKKLNNVPYETVSGYVPLPAGSHTFEVRATGTTLDVAPAVRVVQSLDSEKNYTVAAIGRVADIKGIVYTDDLSPPKSGQAKLRVLHASTDYGPIDVVVKGGASLFTKANFGEATIYADVTNGNYDLEVRRAGSKDVLDSVSGLGLAPGSIYTVAAVGGASATRRLKVISDQEGPSDASVTSSLPGSESAITSGPATPSSTSRPPTTTTGPTTTVPATTSTALAAVTPTTTTTARTETTTSTALEPTTSQQPTTAGVTLSTPDTEPETAVDVTSVETTDVPTTEAAVTDSTTPIGGVATGAGGLAGGGSGITLLAMFALAVSAVGAAWIRRRVR